MYWFKNAIIYRLTKNIDFGGIESKLKECEFTPCGSADVSHFGWSAPLTTSENLAYQADGKILLIAKREEKILPVEVVNRELNKRITALEEKEQRKLKKAERLSLKDDVIATLLPQAFSRIKTTALYIDTLKQLIFVDAASSKTAEDALALLRKSLGSLPVVPLAFNRAPFEVMTKWVTDTAPDWLILREEVEIREKEDLGVTHWRPLPSFLDDEIIQDVISKLKALQSNSDIEAAHNQADKILCDLLNSLGYDDVVKEFENLEKWYA